MEEFYKVYALIWKRVKLNQIFHLTFVHFVLYLNQTNCKNNTNKSYSILYLTILYTLAADNITVINSKLFQLKSCAFQAYNSGNSQKITNW